MQGDQKEEPAPPGYEWQDVKSFDESGKAVFKRELVKLEMVGGPGEEKDADEKQKAINEVNAGIYCLNWSKIKDAFSELKTNNSQG